MAGTVYADELSMSAVFNGKTALHFFSLLARSLQKILVGRVSISGDLVLR